MGWTAFAIGGPIYIIPFLFVSNTVLLEPALNMDLVYTLGRSLIALASMSALVVGWLGGRRIAWPLRILLLGVAALMVHPGLVTSSIGLALVLGIYLFQRASRDAEVSKETGL